MSVTWLKRNFVAKIEVPKISKVGSKCIFFFLTLRYYSWTGEGSQTIHIQIIEHSFVVYINVKLNVHVIFCFPWTVFKHLLTSELVQMQEARSTECPARKCLHFCYWKPIGLEQRTLLGKIVKDLPPKYWTK